MIRTIGVSIESPPDGPESVVVSIGDDRAVYPSSKALQLWWETLQTTPTPEIDIGEARVSAEEIPVLRDALEAVLEARGQRST